MKTKHFMIVVGVGGALVLVYLYLKKSGMLQAWLGGQNEFTDQAKLLEFCTRQNLAIDNGGQAIFIDARGQRHSASCSDWLRAQDGSGGGQTAGLAAVRQTDGTLLEKLRNAALTNPVMGLDRANVAQWNLLLKEIDPQARTSDMSEAGIDGARMMNAAEYLAHRHQAGLTALAPVEVAFPNPMSWVN